MTDEFKNKGQAKKAQKPEKTNRGRSAEARDPNRPVDEFGEKLPLPPRYPEEDEEVEVEEELVP